MHRQVPGVKKGAASFLAFSICSFTFAQGTIKEFVEATRWTSSATVGMRARLVEETHELDGSTRSTSITTNEWIQSGSKMLKRAVERMVDGKKWPVLSQLLTDGTDTYELTETRQVGGGIFRQASIDVGGRLPANVLLVAYSVDGEALAQALDSGRYTLISNSPEGPCFEGVANSKQRLRFWLDPRHGFLVNHSILIGDPAYTQELRITKFLISGGMYYPAESEFTGHFGDPAQANVSIRSHVSDVAFGKIPDAQFDPHLAVGTLVRDNKTGRIYEVGKDGGELLVGHVRAASAGGTNASAQWFGLPLIIGASVLGVAGLTQLRSRIAGRR